ncbi:MAG: type II toxin-antitoxin system Phd/YefM family antitoxin [Terrimicrobiaceae bacterium]
MIDTYNMKEAQAQLTKLCRGDRQFVIANRNKPTFVAMPVADYEALMETIDVLADPAAMQEVVRVKAGRGTYQTLNLDDEGFGL